MPNYIDVIRDEYRRGKRGPRYYNNGGEMIPASRTNATRKELGNTRQGTLVPSGYGYGPFGSTGIQNPTNNYGGVTGNVIAPNSAYHPTPARQATDVALSGNAQLNDGDARAQAISTGKNVLSSSGATYFPSGGYARTSSTARPIADTVKDFSNPVIAPERAASFLTTRTDRDTDFSNTFARIGSELVGGRASPEAVRTTPAIPLVHTAIRPVEPTATSASPAQPYRSPAAAFIAGGTRNVLENVSSAFTYPAHIAANAYRGVRRFGKEVYENY